MKQVIDGLYSNNFELTFFGGLDHLEIASDTLLLFAKLQEFLSINNHLLLIQVKFQMN